MNEPDNKASQPCYSDSPCKINARLENIRSFKELTGYLTVPPHRTYWTLCNHQPTSKGSEIVQLTSSGVIKPEQFHGVDLNQTIISENQRLHPQAHWYCGDWIDVISSNVFNPSMVYLDTTSFADHYAAINMTTRTMLLCPPKTVLIVNVMLNDPRSNKHFNPTTLVKKICRQIPTSELKLWHPAISNYSYNTTGKTEMLSYIFYKE